MFFIPKLQARHGFFGPEYDSPEYSSNSQLQTGVEKLFGKQIDKSVLSITKTDLIWFF
jgi:hypothetical protein